MAKALEQRQPERGAMTTGAVARLLGVPFYRVRYAVATRGIQPASRVGIFRLWSEDQVAKIREALEDITAGGGPVLKSCTPEGRR